VLFTMLSFLFQLVTLPLCGEVFTRECVFTFHPFHCKACWLNKKFASYLLICSDRYCASPCFQPCPSLLPPPVLFFYYYSGGKEMHAITGKWLWLWKIVGFLFLPHVLPLLCFQDGHIALHLAVRRCQIEVVKTLINQGCFVDFQDRHGNTPLHVACKDGNVPIVMALCEAGCNLDVTNKVNEIWHWTALFKRSPIALDDLLYFAS